MFEAAIKIFNGLLEILSGVFTGNFEKIKEGVCSIFGGIKDVFSGVFKGIINFAIDSINFFIRKINSVIGLVSKIPGIKALVGTFKIAEVPRLELGGLVSPGQLFVARESGPELVGSYGVYAAVMNNNQIVESVSRGVYNAVTNALKQNNQQGGSYTFTIHNELNGREISKQVFKYHNDYVKMQGRSPLII